MKKTIAAIYLKSIAESCDTSASLMDRFETQESKGKEVFLRVLNTNVRKKGVAHGKIQ